jgi:hypothetical protein
MLAAIAKEKQISAAMHVHSDGETRVGFTTCRTESSTRLLSSRDCCAARVRHRVSEHG